MHTCYQGRIESVGREGMQLQCSVLKHQNSYEFIHDFKNSNNIHEFTGVYQLKWRHSLLERLLTKKLLKTKVQVSSKEICNMAINPLMGSNAFRRLKPRPRHWSP